MSYHFVVRAKFTELAKSLELRVLVWRDPPRDNKCLGSVARKSEPLISQVFVVPAREDMEGREMEKKMFMLRKVGTLCSLYELLTGLCCVRLPPTPSPRPG